MPRIDDILDFWFGRPGDAGYGGKREIWFEKNDDFDAEIRDRFMVDYEAAEAGRLDPMQRTARGALALVILLDQFPRNMFRGQSRSFATDARAGEIARHAIEQGYDRGLALGTQQFYYMPFEHGEDPTDQRRSVELFRASAEDERKTENIGYAVQHLEIIERFGRFPHRNAILGRESTDEELNFLTDGGDDVHFGTKTEQQT